VTGGVQFRPGKGARKPIRARLIGLIVVLALTGGALIARQLASRPSNDGVLVEVRGQVERPGWHRLQHPTVRAAVEAAGGSTDGLSEQPLHQGDLVRVGSDGVQVAPTGDSLLVALPVDVNQANAESLRAVPGIGQATARAVVEERVAHGPYYAISDLSRVPGLGPSTVKQISSLLTVGDIGPRPPMVPLDLNSATALQLEGLPGIGPVGAARVVVHREDHGPFVSVDALSNVHGIGSATVDKVRRYVRVVVPPPTPESP
jgi:competence ComEA-like helix-hairpin-helix protein